MFTSRQRRINHLCAQIVSIRTSDTSTDSKTLLIEEHLKELETLFQEEKIRRDRPDGTDAVLFLDKFLRKSIFYTMTGEFCEQMLSAFPELQESFTLLCILWIKRVNERGKGKIRESEVFKYAKLAHETFEYVFKDSYEENY